MKLNKRSIKNLTVNSRSITDEEKKEVNGGWTFTVIVPIVTLSVAMCDIIEK